MSALKNKKMEPIKEIEKIMNTKAYSESILRNFHSKIEAQDVPQWLRERVKKIYGEDYIFKIPGLFTGKRGCLDHWGYDKKTKEFVMYPYECSQKSIEALLNICNILNVEISIRGRSNWSLDTFAIVIRPKHQIDDKE